MDSPAPPAAPRLRGRRRTPVWGGLLLAALLAAGAPTTAQPAGRDGAVDGAESEEERYQVLPRPGGALWRLDTRTGELCVFEFTGSQPGGAVLNAGCASDAEPGSEGAIRRYALAGRGREEVWRLDSRTGRVCVFAYRPVFPANPVVRVGCSVREAGPGR